MKQEKIDFRKLGLKCGIEIHQQLNTRKLFCYCPSRIRDDPPDIRVERKLKAVVGETGEIDRAASHESERAKRIVYQGYKDTTCPIEFDEEPPRSMNREALDVVLKVSRMLDAKVLDEIQVMRKTVVDGSNTSGFQRTALVGRNGSLKTEHGNIGIPTIIIEEDAAKIVEQEPDRAVYNLSRLGIPLIEIGTDPDIKTPEQAHDVALKLGMILRSTGEVKRGLGTIRQDLNVSITKGTRIELKGAQDLKMISTWVANEALRQKNLSELKKELLDAKASILKTKHDVTEIFKRSKCKVISSALKKGGLAKAVLLRNFNSFLGREIQPGKRLGTEVSDYAKAKSGVKGLFHSDEELSRYSISDNELTKIKKTLRCRKNDAFILIADSEDKVDIALDAGLERAMLAMQKIPEEVRRANPDGTSTFMRPMPGAARMYPETDCLPIRTSELLSKIEIPEMIEDKKKRYESQYSLGNDLSVKISRFDYSVLDKVDSFDDLVDKFPNIKPVFLAESLISIPKELRKRYDVNVQDFSRVYKSIFYLLEKLNEGELSRGAFLDVLADVVRGKKVDFSQYKKIDDKQLEKELKKIVEENKGKPFGALMGKAMERFKGRADGKRVSEILKKLAR